MNAIGKPQKYVEKIGLGKIVIKLYEMVQDWASTSRNVRETLSDTY